MKDTKGFTLVELLAVIVILGLIGVLTTTVINIVIKNGKEKTAKANAETILNAAYNYVQQYPEYLPNEVNEISSLTYKDLENAGLIKSDMKNPLTNELYDDNMEIKIIYYEEMPAKIMHKYYKFFGKYMFVFSTSDDEINDETNDETDAGINDEINDETDAEINDETDDEINEQPEKTKERLYCVTGSSFDSYEGYTSYFTFEFDADGNLKKATDDMRNFNLSNDYMYSCENRNRIVGVEGISCVDYTTDDGLEGQTLVKDFSILDSNYYDYEFSVPALTFDSILEEYTNSYNYTCSTKSMPSGVNPYHLFCEYKDKNGNSEVWHLRYKNNKIVDMWINLIPNVKKTETNLCKSSECDGLVGCQCNKSTRYIFHRDSGWGNTSTEKIESYYLTVPTTIVAGKSYAINVLTEKHGGIDLNGTREEHKEYLKGKGFVCS